MITANEIAAQSHDHIEAGWTTGQMEDSQGNVCSLGAIRKAVKQNLGTTMDDFLAACAAGNTVGLAVREQMCEMTGYRIAVDRFNDGKRDKEAVKTAFWKALCSLEERAA